MEEIWHDRKRNFMGWPWSFTRYGLTKELLTIKTGFFTTREDEVRLYRITDISMTVTLGQKLAKIGTLKCCSADKTLGDFEIKNIRDPKKVKALLSELIEKERAAKRVSSREYFSHNDADHDGIPDDIDDDNDNDD